MMIILNAISRVLSVLKEWARIALTNGARLGMYSAKVSQRGSLVSTDHESSNATVDRIVYQLGIRSHVPNP